MFWQSVRRSDAPSIFDFPIINSVCVGAPERQFLMGGCGLGAGIWALEQVSELPILWASVQFVGAPLLGSQCTIETEILHNGRRSVHGRASIIQDGKPLHIISGSHAKLDKPDSATYLSMPDVPPPEDCESLGDKLYVEVENLQQRIDIRWAGNDPDTGRGYLWFRSVDGLPMTASWLSIIADYMPAPHPATNRCTSLDNVIRIHQLAESEWVLGECLVSEYRNGHFHGAINLFSRDGVLLATGNQTGLQGGT